MEGGIKMKTYATWEAIKMLTEDSKLKFEDRNTGSRVLMARKEEGNCASIVIKTTGFYNNKLLLQNEWVLVQQPVSFTEAVKASYKGKTIYCVLPQSEYAYISKIDKLESLTDSNGNGLSTQEILEGKWYIKEDEE